MQIHALMFLNSLINFFGPKLLYFKEQLQAHCANQFKFSVPHN